MLLDGQLPQAVQQAAQILREGGLLGLPTETVYGLAADAENEQAVGAIFTAKGRPRQHPLIVHVADSAAVPHFAAQVPPFAERLMQAFWPGPLTLILPRRPGVAARAAGGQDSVGLRCPSHPVAQALLRAVAGLGVAGVAAPSANRFGRVSPTTSAHVRDEFGPTLCVLDGGACSVGIESSIVDCTRGVPVLLRPGVITRARLAAACGQPVRTPDELAQAAPRASGTLAAHYAPQAQVHLFDAAAWPDLAGAPGLALYARSAPPAPLPAGVLWRRMPAQPEAAAQQLFAVLRELDALGVRQIWIERPPADPGWDGISDRLQRAAAASLH